ncbi:eCIS core domain-containing protein [Streptomyces lancefieldiae]|uniref:DUF4157 domain-containing protein n=1 Tax=Streptomyces lancefieldiae TaxID=3075520 RepID=A0ABU3B1B5_9ACTN|nr:DUF4157 domain-containing protein [Streptomyces sp. DSM 40712]MDT0616252.1 DUF4157 domain-containing protein [Streptomyces sp. DSM 40712]
MHAHETQAAQQSGKQSPARRSAVPGTTAGRMLALQNQAGNAAVSRAVQRARHEHGPGCGHAQEAAENADVQRRVSADSGFFEEPRVSVNDAISTPGKPLPARIREPAEQAYGMSFGHVTLHDNPVAQRSAVDLQAIAYTTGSHIVAQRSLDDATLFHEAHHVFQQSRGKVAGTNNGFGESVSSPDHSEEIEAAQAGERMARGQSPL